VRFPLSGPLPPINPLPVEIEDGEQPIVSPDRKWLAFIRAKDGRGSLWLKNFPPEEDEGPSLVSSRGGGYSQGNRSIERTELTPAVSLLI
jgi:hypothetical protein